MIRKGIREKISEERQVSLEEAERVYIEQAKRQAKMIHDAQKTKQIMDFAQKLQKLLWSYGTVLKQCTSMSCESITCFSVPLCSARHKHVALACQESSRHSQ
jgi:hypothetical protein